MTEPEFNSYLIKSAPELLKYAMNLTKNRDDSQDLLQDTCIKALRYREGLTNHDNLISWLMVIMKNTFINNYRQQKYRKTVLDVTPDLFYIDKGSEKGHISPESNLAVKDILGAINELDHKYQVPFKMFIHGYKYEEIADEMGVNLVTIKSRIHLARKELMSALK
jgi:RNA polymerase sigma factor (sigma-70 family)